MMRAVCGPATLVSRGYACHGCDSESSRLLSIPPRGTGQRPVPPKPRDCFLAGTCTPGPIPVNLRQPVITYKTKDVTSISDVPGARRITEILPTPQHPVIGITVYNAPAGDDSNPQADAPPAMSPSSPAPSPTSETPPSKSPTQAPSSPAPQETTKLQVFSRLRRAEQTGCNNRCPRDRVVELQWA
jgi:hypothetical protein